MAPAIFNFAEDTQTINVGGVDVSYNPLHGPCCEFPIHRLGGLLSPSWQSRHVILHHWILLRFNSTQDAQNFRLSPEPDPSAVKGALLIRDITEIRACPAPVEPGNHPYCVALGMRGSYEFISLPSEYARQQLVQAVAAGRPIVSANRSTPMDLKAWWRRAGTMPWSADPAPVLQLAAGHPDQPAVREWTGVAGGSAEAANEDNNGFSEFLAALCVAPFMQERTKLISSRVSAGVTAVQLAEILRVLPFKNERLDAVKKLASPEMASGKNKDVITGALAFPDEREGVEQALKEVAEHE